MDFRISLERQFRQTVDDNAPLRGWKLTAVTFDMVKFLLRVRCDWRCYVYAFQHAPLMPMNALAVLAVTVACATLRLGAAEVKSLSSSTLPSWIVNPSIQLHNWMRRQVHGIERCVTNQWYPPPTGDTQQPNVQFCLAFLRPCFCFCCWPTKLRTHQA